MIKRSIYRGIATFMVGVVLICTLGNDDVQAKEKSSENAADVICNVTGTNDINTDTYETKDSVAVADGYEVVIDMPREATNPVSLNDGMGEEVEFLLPSEVENSVGTMTENGTVVYENEKDKVTIGVQPLQENQNNVTFEGVRTTITIEDASASKEYAFSYNLDAGSKLITAKELLGEEYDTGEVFIVNEKGEISYAIEAPWAKDANGNDIETFYKVEGNILIQVVNFDEDTAFPVVADPSVWKVATCAAAIGAVLVSSVLAVAKLAKIKNILKH